MLSKNIISLDDVILFQEDLLRTSLCEKNDANFVNYMFTAMQQYIEYDASCFGIANTNNSQFKVLKVFCNYLP